jgi:hypothetical protein
MGNRTAVSRIADPGRFCCRSDQSEPGASACREKPTGIAEGISGPPGQSNPEALGPHDRSLHTGDLQILFAVDLFNEGLDIPSIDTVLQLRPTESATPSAIAFLQQHRPAAPPLTLRPALPRPARRQPPSAAGAAAIPRCRRRDRPRQRSGPLARGARHGTGRLPRHRRHELQRPAARAGLAPGSCPSRSRRLLRSSRGTSHARDRQSMACSTRTTPIACAGSRPSWRPPPHRIPPAWASANGASG